MRVQLAKVGQWEDSAHDLVSDMVSPHYPAPALSVASFIPEVSGVTDGTAKMTSGITRNPPSTFCQRIQTSIMRVFLQT